MEKYISQKSQKIVSALYLITDHIKDGDVIKWEIREDGISLISNSLLLNTVYPSDKENAYKAIILNLEKIISLLNVSLISSVISNMNATIMIHELESLLLFVEKESKGNLLPGYILSDSFFSDEKVIKKDIVNDKGHDSQSRTNTISSQNSANKTVSRKDSILAILRTNSNLTIKDFAKVIKDCSEKTIQRELIALVKSGVVKRVGERRWSTYSLS